MVHRIYLIFDHHKMRRGKRIIAAKVMRRIPPVLQISIILISLLLATATPGIITGYFELNKAESALAAKNYSAASAAFESAARRMFWRSDLWEHAGQAALLAGQPQETLRLLEG